MAATHDIGSLFWHHLVYPIKPPVLVERSETQEIDHPYRRGTGWVVRVPFTRQAVVIGKWHTSHGESEALTYAIAGRALDTAEVDWDLVRHGEQEC